MNQLAVETTPIPGLLVVRLPVHEDARGWFKETWQREKMVALGLPDFTPVQANVSHNISRGATRGLHAEPWEKLVSLATGRAFGAWVDLREGASFGATFWTTLDPSVSVFVPRGVANGYQTLDDDVAYSYLVNDHWQPGQTYLAVALDDPAPGVPWPIPIGEAEISEKDRRNPRLQEVVPFRSRRPLILGADGQVGRALQQVFPQARAVGRAELDLTDAAAVQAWPWNDHDIVMNAAAYTKVDAAETDAGRSLCWQVNAAAPARLAALSARHRFRLIHFSTDYVYDGSLKKHDEDEPLAPLSAYGQSKAAGDLAILAGAFEPLVLRTSWVIGDGSNFVRTMLGLAHSGASPRVVSDQVGRLTFTDDLAEATRHLLECGMEGVVHVSSGGAPMSWYEIACSIFASANREISDVVAVGAAEYAAGGRVAPRPGSSVLSLERLRRSGWDPGDQLDRLRAYASLTADLPAGW